MLIDTTTGTEKCHMIPVNVGQTKTLLIDTPGFDDTFRTDADILAEIATLLDLQHQSGIALKGIIFLHRISSNRFGRSSYKMINIFRRICGKAALPNVTLVTSRWSDVDEQTGAMREKDLMEYYWDFMLNSGSQISRFYGDRDSAIVLVSQLLHKESVVLEIQQELRAGRTLKETAAGAYVTEDIRTLKAEHAQDIQNLEDSLREQLKENDAMMNEELQRALKEEREKLGFQQKREADLDKAMDTMRASRTRAAEMFNTAAATTLPLTAQAVQKLRQKPTVSCTQGSGSSSVREQRKMSSTEPRPPQEILEDIMAEKLPEVFGGKSSQQTAWTGLLPTKAFHDFFLDLSDAAHPTFISECRKALKAEIDPGFPHPSAQSEERFLLSILTELQWCPERHERGFSFSIESSDSVLWVDRLKLAIEQSTRSEWSWWPLSPPPRVESEAHVRLEPLGLRQLFSATALLRRAICLVSSQ